MTAAIGSEPVGEVGEGRLVVGFEDQPHYFLEQLIRPCRYPERSLFSIGLRDIYTTHGGPLVSLEAYLFDDLVDFLHAHRIHGLTASAFGHRTLVGVDVHVGMN